MGKAPMFVMGSIGCALVGIGTNAWVGWGCFLIFMTLPYYESPL